ncbi:hypothetical protein RHOSPDRAFT_33825 [Rhodotorula sp. JG-1b]|nr:hypothetical protein RHOSPDRAFT_33825 [Rhodotorula sp. JG-1b]
MSTPKVTVHRSVLAQTLIPGLPGGSLVDFGAFQHVEGAAVVGVFRNHGTEPAFEIASYPEDEFKYIIDGVLAVQQDGKRVTGVAGDIVHIPKGSKFTVLPTIFTAVYFSARSVAFPQQSAQARL